MFRNQNQLRPSEKLDVLYRLFHGQKMSELVDKLDTRRVIGLQKFLWETAAEFGIICHGKNFTRKEITRKMTPTAAYQKKRGCTERVYACKGTSCIETHPECARKKIKEHINIMSEKVHEYIRIKQQYEKIR